MSFALKYAFGNCVKNAFENCVKRAFGIKSVYNKRWGFAVKPLRPLTKFKFKNFLLVYNR